MPLRARFAALLFGASAPVRPIARERVTSTITDGWIAPAHERRLIDAGRQAVDDLTARTRVERSAHFTAPRFSA